jgi:hypothetical protein
MRLDRKIQESQTAHNTIVIGPDDLGVAGNAPPTVDLKAKTCLAALYGSNSLKSATVFGKIQHYAAVFSPELQIHQLLRASP